MLPKDGKHSIDERMKCELWYIYGGFPMIGRLVSEMFSPAGLQEWLKIHALKGSI